MLDLCKLEIEHLNLSRQRVEGVFQLVSKCFIRLMMGQKKKKVSLKTSAAVVTRVINDNFQWFTVNI